MNKERHRELTYPPAYLGEGSSRFLQPISPEMNGKIQGGSDFAGQIIELKDRLARL